MRFKDVKNSENIEISRFLTFSKNALNVYFRHIVYKIIINKISKLI